MRFALRYRYVSSEKAMGAGGRRTTCDVLFSNSNKVGEKSRNRRKIVDCEAKISTP